MLTLFLEWFAGRLSCHGTFSQGRNCFLLRFREGTGCWIFIFTFFLSVYLVCVGFVSQCVCLLCGCCIDGALTSLVMAHHQLKLFGREEIASWWG